MIKMLVISAAAALTAALVASPATALVPPLANNCGNQSETGHWIYPVLVKGLSPGDGVAVVVGVEGVVTDPMIGDNPIYLYTGASPSQTGGFVVWYDRTIQYGQHQDIIASAALVHPDYLGAYHQGVWPAGNTFNSFYWHGVEPASMCPGIAVDGYCPKTHIVYWSAALQPFSAYQIDTLAPIRLDNPQAARPPTPEPVPMCNAISQ